MIRVPVTITSWRCAAWAVGLTVVLAPLGVRAHPVAPAAPVALDLPAEPTSDPLVVRLVTEHPGLHVLRSIVADVDGDGDLDVLVSTAEAPLALWLNDGTDHFTRATTAPTTALTSEGGASVRPFGQTAPGLVAGSKWRHAQAAYASLVPQFPIRTAVALPAALCPTIDILASSPSRAPPTT